MDSCGVYSNRHVSVIVLSNSRLSFNGSILFGGNFLHGLNIGLQLYLYSLEQRFGLTPQHQFPFFSSLSWFAAVHYVRVLRSIAIRLRKVITGADFDAMDAAATAAAERSAGGASEERSGRGGRSDGDSDENADGADDDELSSMYSRAFPNTFYTPRLFPERQSFRKGLSDAAVTILKELTHWEIEGLWALANQLRQWIFRRDHVSGSVPSSPPSPIHCSCSDHSSGEAASKVPSDCSHCGKRRVPGSNPLPRKRAHKPPIDGLARNIEFKFSSDDSAGGDDEDTTVEDDGSVERPIKRRRFSFDVPKSKKVVVRMPEPRFFRSGARDSASSPPASKKPRQDTGPNFPPNHNELSGEESSHRKSTHMWSDMSDFGIDELPANLSVGAPKDKFSAVEERSMGDGVWRRPSMRVRRGIPECIPCPEELVDDLERLLQFYSRVGGGAGAQFRRGKALLF